MMMMVLVMMMMVIVVQENDVENGHPAVSDDSSPEEVEPRLLRKQLLEVGDCVTFVSNFHSFYHAAVCRAVLPIAMVSVRHDVNCDKTKAPSEKSSIMTNRKSTTRFPMSL